MGPTAEGAPVVDAALAGLGMEQRTRTVFGVDDGFSACGAPGACGYPCFAAGEVGCAPGLSKATAIRQTCAVAIQGPRLQLGVDFAHLAYCSVEIGCGLHGQFSWATPTRQGQERAPEWWSGGAPLPAEELLGNDEQGLATTDCQRGIDTAIKGGEDRSMMDGQSEKIKVGKLLVADPSQGGDAHEVVEGNVI